MLLRIFSRAWAPKDMAAIDKPVFGFDYIALDATQITVPKELTAAQGDFVTFGDNDGILSAVDKSAPGKTVLTVKPLLELLNISAYRPRQYLYEQPVENFFSEWISDEFIYNADTVQNIEGMTVEVLSSTGGAKLNLVDDVNNIYEIAVKALLKYRMVISMRLKPQEKKLICKIGVNSTAPDYVRLDTDNIIDKKVILADSIGACNKLTAVDGNGLERNMVYYADGYDVPAVPVTEIIKAGSREDFKVGTKYKWIYMPMRPKIPPAGVNVDAWFDGGATTVEIYNAQYGDITPPLIIITTRTLTFYYFHIAQVVDGYSYDAEKWYQKEGSTITLCGNEIPSNGVNEEGKPGLLLEYTVDEETQDTGELTYAVRLDLLGDYVATKPIEFYERAIERTYELFKIDGAKNLIEAAVLETDRLMPAIEIGRVDNIIVDGNEIPCVMTGYRVDGRKITRIWGGVRQELTKKLKMERR